jgi:hypothetical protein
MNSPKNPISHRKMHMISESSSTLPHPALRQANLAHKMHRRREKLLTRSRRGSTETAAAEAGRSARGPKCQGLNGKSTTVLCSDRVRSELASQLTAAAGLAYHIHHQFAEKAPVFYRTSPSARAALVHSSMQGLDRAVF